MTLCGLQRLLFILGRKVVASFRALAETTFTQVLTGDKSLVEIIKENTKLTDTTLSVSHTRELKKTLIKKDKPMISLTKIESDYSIRNFTVNNKQYLSVHDIIRLVCNTSRDHARNIQRRMVYSQNNQWSKFDIISHQCPGPRQHFISMISVDDAIDMITYIPTTTAMTFKSSMMKIISRFIKGDLSLNQEIVENNNMDISKSFPRFIQMVRQDTKRKLSEMMEEIPATAYIYVTYSPAFPDLVKIGKSRNVKARISSGNTFIAPAPHFIVAMAPTFNATRDELAAHTHFAKYRQEGEFFKITQEEAKTYLNLTIKVLHEQELEAYSSGSKGSLIFV